MNNNMTQVPEGFKLADFSGNFLKSNGPFYVRKDDDRWLVAQWVEEKHVNYIDVAHGGMLSTLCDVAMSTQPYLASEGKPAVTTTTMTVNFLSVAKLGDLLLADCRMTRMGKRTAHVQGAIYRGDDILVTMSGVFGIYHGK